MKLKNNVKLLITCDSGAGAGKTTVAKFLSKKFRLNLLTSGLLYRYVANELLISKKRTTNVSFLKKIIKNINSKLLKNPKLYSPQVTNYTQKIAKIKKVRLMLRGYQKKFSKKRLVILEGRDMGILFPNADVKIFLKCSLKVAAKRRLKEFKKANKKITLKMVKKAIRLRDHVDSTRKFSPLRIPKGAVVVDTTNISKQEMFRRVLKVIEGKLLLKYGRNFKAR